MNQFVVRETSNTNLLKNLNGELIKSDEEISFFSSERLKCSSQHQHNKQILIMWYDVLISACLSKKFNSMCV